MSSFAFDQEKLIQAALESGASPLAIEEGTGLAEAWIERGVLHDTPIVAVECGFVWWVEERTAIVGVQDLLTLEDRGEAQTGVGLGCGADKSGRTLDNTGNQTTTPSPDQVIVGNEWKTTKESSKWWNEDKWLEGISEGSQIAVYALALQNGIYYPKGTPALSHYDAKTGESYPEVSQLYKPIIPAVATPRIRVKAISKSNPPVIWPRREEDGIITFSPARLEATRQALISEAESIRARRKKVGLDGIWRVPGIWCTNMFRRTCEFHEDCVKQRPARPVNAFDPNDPAFKLAIPHIDKIDNDVVILSASSYAKSCECAEAYRRGLAREGKESSLALDTGTVFHAVVGEGYRQLQSYQIGNKGEEQ